MKRLKKKSSHLHAVIPFISSFRFFFFFALSWRFFCVPGRHSFFYSTIFRKHFNRVFSHKNCSLKCSNISVFIKRNYFYYLLSTIKYFSLKIRNFLFIRDKLSINCIKNVLFALSPSKAQLPQLRHLHQKW